MTETPRTNAAAFTEWSGQMVMVTVEFAQQLEREVIAAQKELEELKESFRKQYEISEGWRKLSESEHARREKAEQALVLRGEPTMGMWDDFCSVFPVPFDDFLKAYKFMVGNMPALRGEPVATHWYVQSRIGSDAYLHPTLESAQKAITILNDDYADEGPHIIVPLYAAPISGERAIPAGHCTLFVPHSSACAQQAQCLAVSGERDAKKIVCHAEGPRCHGCAHYRGEADICVYAPAVSGERVRPDHGGIYPRTAAASTVCACGVMVPQNICNGIESDLVDTEAMLVSGEPK